MRYCFEQNLEEIHYRDFSFNSKNTICQVQKLAQNESGGLAYNKIPCGCCFKSWLFCFPACSLLMAYEGSGVLPRSLDSVLAKKLLSQLQTRPDQLWP